jgi:N-acetylated-alpha-linked acidic dipeptidase
VAYLNLDSSVSGPRLRASGSPLLAHFIRATAEDLPHPTDSTRTLWDATRDDGTLFGPGGNVTINEEVLSIHEMRYGKADNVGVAPLGSGSDYTVFLQRNGIPSGNGGFSSTLHDPVYHYHSVFDSERWQELYADPGFSRHVAVAKHLGLQTLRLASSAVLPFNATHYAYELGSYLDGVETIAGTTSLDINFASLRQSLHDLQKSATALDEEKAAAHADLIKLLKRIGRRHRRHRLHRAIWKAKCALKKLFGRKCSCPHKDKDAALSQHHGPPDVASLLTEAGLDEDMVLGILYHGGFSDETGHLAAQIVKGKGHKKRVLKRLIKIIRRIQAANKKTAAIEKGFISEEGIKDREWYKHLAVAPGKWLGYGATTLPALTEAITFEKNSTLAQYEADRLQSLVDKIVKKIEV